MIKIDLTDTVKIFYNKLADWIDKDEVLSNLIKEKEVDIKVKYFRRDQLPPEVRPADLGRLGGLNGQDEDNAGEQNAGNGQQQTGRLIGAAEHDDDLDLYEGLGKRVRREGDNEEFERNSRQQR